MSRDPLLKPALFFLGIILAFFQIYFFIFHNVGLTAVIGGLFFAFALPLSLYRRNWISFGMLFLGIFMKRFSTISIEMIILSNAVFYSAVAYLIFCEVKEKLKWREKN